MQFSYIWHVVFISLLCASWWQGCAEITIDEIPLDNDDDSIFSPDDTMPTDFEKPEETTETVEDPGTDADSDEDAPTDSGRDLEEDKDSDSSSTSETDAEPDTETEDDTPPETDSDSVDTQEPDTGQQTDPDPSDGGAHLCDSTPLLASDVPAYIDTLSSPSVALGQSFKPISPNINAIKIGLYENQVDLGAHTIQLVEGEPGELKLVGSWTADVPLNDDLSYSELCLAIGNFTFDMTKTYSILIFPHENTHSEATISVLTNISDTYADGRAWRTDGSGIWYGMSYDIYFVFY